MQPRSTLQAPPKVKMQLLILLVLATRISYLESKAIELKDGECVPRNISCSCASPLKRPYAYLINIAIQQCKIEDKSCGVCKDDPESDETKCRRQNCFLCTSKQSREQCLQERNPYSNISCLETATPDNSVGSVSFEIHQLEVGAQMVFSCLDGFSLSGEKSIECKTDGSWSHPIPHCVRNTSSSTSNTKSCPELKDENGLKRVFSYRVSKLEIGATVEFSCIDDLVLSGAAKIECASNGTWSSTPPKCIPDEKNNVSCSDPGIPPASQRLAQYKFHQLEVGAIMEFSCYPGFLLSGAVKISCTPSGNWSSPLPECLKNVSCSDPGIPFGSNRKAQFRVDEVEVGARIEFSCTDGFRLNGVPNIECLPTGSWSAKTPECIPTTTSAIEIPDGIPVTRPPK
jgi:hypothetical protein